MPKQYVIQEVKDWTKVTAPVADIVLHAKNFYFDGSINAYGIHFYSGQIWTGQYVGVAWLPSGEVVSPGPIQNSQIISIESRFGCNPWLMLEGILSDDEFPAYLEFSEREGDPIFEVFSDQQSINAEANDGFGGELLLALSFVNSCYWLCRNGLKKTLEKRSQNFVSKIRGKVDIARNIRTNTMKGRTDRFYCSYPSFTKDSVENRVLKKALEQCSKTIERKEYSSPELTKRLNYCKRALKGVTITNLKTSDLNSVSISGFYSYYRPSIEQARFVLFGKGRDLGISRHKGTRHYVPTLPYMINMQLLFELHVRSTLKKSLPREYELLPYQYPFPVRKQGFDIPGLHITKNLIPDIVIVEKETNNVALVLDVKYKQSDRMSREDTLQLLAYHHVCGGQAVGFVFPGRESMLKSETVELTLNNSYIEEGTSYYEIIIGDNFPESILNYIIQ